MSVIELDEIGVFNGECWISEPIYSYDLDEYGCRRKNNVLLYPVIDSCNQCICWAIVIEYMGEKKVSVTLECTDIIDFMINNTDRGIALVYQNNKLNIWDGENLVSYSNNVAVKQVGYRDRNNMRSIKLQVITPQYKLNIIRESTRGEDDSSAYVNIPTIRQLTNSNWCWAACMASIVNYEKGYHYSCQGMANLYTTNLQQGANDYAVQSRLQSFGIYTTLVNPFSNQSLLPILSSISRGYPCYSKFEPVAGGDDHAVVIRGINFDSASVSIMNPSWLYTQPYHQGSIWNLHGDSGVVRYYQINTGEIYMMVTFLHQ